MNFTTWRCTVPHRRTRSPPQLPQPQAQPPHQKPQLPKTWYDPHICRCHLLLMPARLWIISSLSSLSFSSKQYFRKDSWSTWALLTVRRGKLTGRKCSLQLDRKAKGHRHAEGRTWRTQLGGLLQPVGVPWFEVHQKKNNPKTQNIYCSCTTTIRYEISNPKRVLILGRDHSGLHKVDLKDRRAFPSEMKVLSSRIQHAEPSSESLLCAAALASFW